MSIHEKKYICPPNIKQMKYNISILLSVCLTITIAILLFSEVNSSLKRTKDIETIVISHIFEDVVKNDRNIRIEGYNRIVRIPNISQVSEDSIRFETAKGLSLYRKPTDSLPKDMSIDDKEFIASQLFLIKKNPIKAYVLDSMLQVNLQARGITVQTAVSYQGKLGNMVHKEISTLDGLPLAGSQSLLPVNFAIPAMDFEIELDGHVKYPLYYLFKKTPNLLLNSFVYLLFICFGVFIVWCLIIIKKRTSRLVLPASNEFASYTEIESNPLPVVKAIDPSPIEEFPKKSDSEIQITDDLFINKNTGEIRKKKEIVFQLKEYRLKLFLFLLEGPDYYQSYEKIKEVIWHNKDTANANINKTVIRLRKNLKSASIPLSIESVRALGYQIREENDKPSK